MFGVIGIGVQTQYRVYRHWLFLIQFFSINWNSIICVFIQIGFRPLNSVLESRDSSREIYSLIPGFVIFLTGFWFSDTV